MSPVWGKRRFLPSSTAWYMLLGILGSTHTLGYSVYLCVLMTSIDNAALRCAALSLFGPAVEYSTMMCWAAFEP